MHKLDTCTSGVESIRVALLSRCPFFWLVWTVCEYSFCVTKDCKFGFISLFKWLCGCNVTWHSLCQFAIRRSGAVLYLNTPLCVFCVPLSFQDFDAQSDTYVILHVRWEKCDFCIVLNESVEWDAIFMPPLHMSGVTSTYGIRRVRHDVGVHPPFSILKEIPFYWDLFLFRLAGRKLSRIEHWRILQGLVFWNQSFPNCSALKYWSALCAMMFVSSDPAKKRGDYIIPSRAVKFMNFYIPSRPASRRKEV